ncbi:MAG TPA: hypothetical protein PKH39_12080 [Woeseiaceae bacterium]|nr:hypothetical protein [Woeseiaceae bacterium]
MSSQTRFDPKALAAHVMIALFVGAAISYFTDAKWLAAFFWVSAAMFINGSLATVEDARPGGFNNSDGAETPDIAKGWGATKYGLSSLAIFAGLIAAGFAVQSLF